MDAAQRAIRTPDQRIRVFVSSTLRELEPERRAVRAVLERLHLAPVMFELGARPHPPRDLYRSYLDQSDVFIGLYWEKYGWVAPGEEISGLEDEYRLSGGMPLLVYLKEPAPEREERLEALLDAIRDDDRTSYKTFADAEELAELVLADVATLLADRFDAASVAAAAPTDSTSSIPAPYTALVGRGRERDEVRDLLSRPDVRIVTLVGPGGVGKSRLAIEIAGESAAAGREVAFATLESVATADRVVTALARALGVRDAGDAALDDKLVAAVADRDLLLVVDNMEHVLDATPLLVRLVTDAPRLQLLVTSRSPLRVRAERVFDVHPLELPAADASGDAAALSPAVSLFVQRAKAARPSFELTPANSPAVVGLCRALDGMPLAIELAASRIRTMSPEEILARLDSALTLLVGGARDLPERQRTLSTTIQWSVDLLDPRARDALATLSVFVGDFALSSAERLLTDAGIGDPLGALEALLDASLVNRTEHGSDVSFRLLSLVRAYAAGLEDEDARERTVAAWIAHYRALAAQAATGLRGHGQGAWLARLDLEVADLARVERTLLDRGERDAAADFAWSLYLFLWIGGYLGVVRGWMTELMEAVGADDAAIDVRTRAIALYYTNAIRFWEEQAFDPITGMTASRDLFEQSGEASGAALAGVSIALGLLALPAGPDLAAATTELERSIAGFRSVQDAWGEAMALVMVGRLALVVGDVPGALVRFEESLTLARSQDESLGIAIALNHRGWARLASGDVAGAHSDFADGLDRSLALAHDDGIAYGLEGFVGLRAAAGDARAAGELLGAAHALRVRKGLLSTGGFEPYAVALAGLRQAGMGDVLDRAEAAGRTMSVAEVLERVRG